MSQAIYFKLLDKSVKCLTAAIEIYNKPNFEYREEMFCITIINAYELLFKAKILDVNKGKLNILYIYEKNTLKSGEKGNRKLIKRNRCGNFCTIGIFECISILKKKGLLFKEVEDNINSIIEIRDNAIHFINKDNRLEEKIFELCAASIKNFITITQEWFNSNLLNEYNFNVMPLNFKQSNIESKNITKTQNIDNFLEYIDMLTANQSDSNYYTTMKIETKFTKVSGNEDILLRYANEGKKINIEIDDEMYLKLYPMTNEDMKLKVKEKREDLMTGSKIFNEIKKEYQEKERFCKPRYLNPKNKKQVMYWYNPNIVQDIILEYDRRKK